MWKQSGDLNTKWKWNWHTQTEKETELSTLVLLGGRDVGDWRQFVWSHRLPNRILFKASASTEFFAADRSDLYLVSDAQGVVIFNTEIERCDWCIILASLSRGMVLYYDRANENGTGFKFYRMAGSQAVFRLYVCLNLSSP